MIKKLKAKQVNPSSSTLKAHADMNIMPRMTEGEYADLKRDILAHGQLEAIKVYQGRIVDGRERYRVCMELGITPKMVVINAITGTVKELIVSLNAHRRHLTPSQKAMIAARLATSSVGTNQSSADVVKQDDAAAVCGVSVDSLQRAKAVLAFGNESLTEAVRDGRVEVANAANIAKVAAHVRRDMSKLTSDGLKQLAAASKLKLREKKLAGKQAEVELIRKGNKPLVATDTRYGLIQADPPWNYMEETKVGYPTMSLEEICELPVRTIVEDDAVLALWVPPSLLAEGLAVVKAWGFEFKTTAVWDKERQGLGQYFGNQHELLMLATRGSPPRVPTAARHSSVLRESRKGHSRKPESATVMLEGMYEGLSKLELFARGKVREGWTGWGNQCITDQPKGVVAPKKLPKAATAEVVKGKAAKTVSGKVANDGRFKKAA